SISTTFTRMSSMSSATGISILSSIIDNSFLSTVAAVCDRRQCAARTTVGGHRPPLQLVRYGLTLAGVCHHDVSRNFHQFTVAARYGIQVVLHDALAALTEILSQRFLDALEEVFVTDAAFGSERRHAQDHAEEHDALHE